MPDIMHPVLMSLAAMAEGGMKPLRECGRCSLCCKLVPVVSEKVTKIAGTWCPMCTKPGCAIYPERPDVCRVWSCTWTLDPNLADDPELEPRRCHVVIDPVCDEVILRPNAGTEPPEVVTVVQMWCDPAYPGAWRADPVRRAMVYYARQFHAASLVRLNNVIGFLVRPPLLAATGRWEESEHSEPITREEMNDKLTDLGVSVVGTAEEAFEVLRNTKVDRGIKQR